MNENKEKKNIVLDELFSLEVIGKLNHFDKNFVGTPGGFSLVLLELPSYTSLVEFYCNFQ